MAKITKPPEYGLNQEVIKIEDDRQEKRATLAISGGVPPTRRDKMGNILLYEEPLTDGGQQSDSPDQWISVDLQRPDYDDAEAVNVLDSEISELYKSRKLSDERRLRQQIEDLRRQLREASADINIIQVTQEDEGGPRELEPGVIPPVGLTLDLADRNSGEFSQTPLEVVVNTAIYDDEKRELVQIGGPNPIAVNYYVVRNENDIDFAYGYGVNETIFTQRRLQDGKLINLDESFDVVLQLEENESRKNFYGWWYKNDSSGKVNYERITEANQNQIRFNLKKRRNTGINQIDTNRNTYEILIVYKNEAPSDGYVPPDVSVDIAEIDRNMPVRFNKFEIDSFLITKYDRNKNVIGQSRDRYGNPYNAEISKIVKLIELRFDTSKLPAEREFIGWWKESQIGTWSKVSSERILYIGSKKLAPGDVNVVELSDGLSLAAGYIFSDGGKENDGRGGNGEPDDLGGGENEDVQEPDDRGFGDSGDDESQRGDPSGKIVGP